jgi:hypothetical protein
MEVLSWTFLPQPSTCKCLGWTAANHGQDKRGKFINEIFFVQNHMTNPKERHYYYVYATTPVGSSD